MKTVPTQSNRGSITMEGMFQRPDIHTTPSARRSTRTLAGDEHIPRAEGVALPPSTDAFISKGRILKQKPSRCSQKILPSGPALFKAGPE
jgi:hypothetical protein